MNNQAAKRDGLKDFSELKAAKITDCDITVVVGLFELKRPCNHAKPSLYLV